MDVKRAAEVRVEHAKDLGIVRDRDFQSRPRMLRAHDGTRQVRTRVSGSQAPSHCITRERRASCASWRNHPVALAPIAALSYAKVALRINAR
jgi:hypothetical protein